MAEVSDLFSAYLDGELAPSESALVESELAASSSARRELAELRATREMLRSLPPVEPDRPVLAVAHADRLRSAPLGGRRRRVRRVVAAGVAAAAVWVVILSVGVGLGRVPLVPEVSQLQEQHASAAPLEGFETMDIDEMDDPAIMADIGHDMALERVFQRDALVHARYSDGAHSVSVFHEPGRVDWDALPADGETVMMDEGPVWRGEMNGSAVLVTERGDLVVTVVADADMDDDMTMEVSEMVPAMDVSQSVWSRIVDAPGNVFDRLI